MGKGDIKSKRGKLANGSYGKTRKRNETMAKAAVPAAAVEKPEKKAKESKKAAK